MKILCSSSWSSIVALILALAAPGCGGSPGSGTDAGSVDGAMPGTDGAMPGTDGGGSTGSGFRAIELFDESERVTGIFCTGPRACVVSTDTPGSEGHVYATDGTSITATLVTGDSDLAASIGTLGTVGFLGFADVGDRLMVLVNGQEAGFITATGDITSAASWSVTRLGTGRGAELALNTQFALATVGERWVLASQGRILETMDDPAPGAVWDVAWSPAALPSVPADIDTLRAADPTLCNTDPSVAIVPDAIQPIWVAPDLSLLVAPSGAVNQDGDDPAGVCISTDGGHRFHNVAFPGVEDGSGPIGVHCASSDHCIAYGGVDFRPDSVFVFVTENASEGSASTWTRATLPTLVENTRLRGAAFAPDGEHGWVVGAAGPGAPLVLTTSDGGQTWTDSTASVRALAPDVRLHSVYAFDATHVWIGGERDVLLASGE